MADANCPKHLWGFAIMTAIHLINRLLSRTIELKSPIEVMENHFPSVRIKNGLVPDVFGCVSCVYTHRMAVDKRSPKAIKAVFVGYLNTPKGYRCYHPSSRNFFVTKNVVFDEHTFFNQPNKDTKQLNE